MSRNRQRIEIPPDPRADKKLRRLAEELGFCSVNLMVRHLCNELSYCRPRQYFKAVSAFYETCRRR
jgi:alkanesulfonate monooxygenase SsuD/methylene tetrahydromethanopterin reductase-like flavin-dependent oxidoreductase (luciferase family)